MDNPFEIKVYDRNFNFKGYIGNPISLTVIPRFNDVGTATIEVDLDHRLVGALLDEGARVVIRKDGLFLLSGKIVQRSSEGPSLTATLKLAVRSDFRFLKQVLGFPVPNPQFGTLQEQLANGGAGDAKDDPTYAITGNAEAALKAIVTANMVNRLGMPVTVAANQNRGSNIPSGSTIRFNPIFDKLFPAVEQAGLGVTFEQQGSTIVCDVFVPPVCPFILTEESGMLQWWAWSASEARATRMVAISSGQQGTPPQTVRFIDLQVDTTLETNYHEVIEDFENVSNADTYAKLQVENQKLLADAGPKGGFAVRLAETATFNYGKNNLVVGARVTISVNGVTRTDYLREVVMTYTRDDGVAVTPVVGEIQDSPDRTLSNFLVRLLKSVNDMKARK